MVPDAQALVVLSLVLAAFVKWDDVVHFDRCANPALCRTHAAQGFFAQYLVTDTLPLAATDAGYFAGFLSFHFTIMWAERQTHTVRAAMTARIWVPRGLLEIGGAGR